MNCFQVFMIFGLWHLGQTLADIPSGCELLSSFYDLWSLTSQGNGSCVNVLLWIAFKFLWSLVFDITIKNDLEKMVLWIAFKFLWSLVFDIERSTCHYYLIVVNCFQVFMIFGLWHLFSFLPIFPFCCELLSSFYDLWSLTSFLSIAHFIDLLWIAFKFLWSLVFDISIRPKPQQQRITGCH